MFYTKNKIKDDINIIEEYKNFKVLIIDDDENNQFFLKKCILKFTHNIILADDGEIGYQSYIENRPDLIITDISMPNMNGIEMSAKIRKIDKETPIIIQTAIDDHAIIFEAINIGVTNYLLKPHKTEKVNKIIESLFEQIYFKKNFQKQQDFINTLSLALKYSSSMVVISDLRGGVVFANDKFYDFTGYEQSEKTILEIDNIFDSAISIIGLILDFLTQNINKTELALKLNNGNLSWTSATFNKITDASNNTNLVIVLDDITAIKITQQNLIQSNYILEEKVIERTSELIKAKDIAEEANKSKDLFLAKVSHELRTPLNGIIGISDIMLGKEQSTVNLKYLNIIKKSGENLLSLINDIIDFSRLESNKFELHKEEFNLIEIINNVADNFSTLSKSKGIDFNLILDKHLPHIIISDKKRIGQILYNLLSNALKFTDKGKIELLVNLNSVSINKNILSISVKDTGIGIDISNKSKIFESFSQIENTYTRKYSGSGLGLSITKELLELLGGSIDFSSQLGEGTQFNLELPIEIPEFKPNIIQIDSILNKSKEKLLELLNLNLIQNKNILVIEDSEINQEFYRELLLSKNANVFSAFSYAEALELINIDYDLILIDCHLKDIDFKELFNNFISDYYAKLQEVYKYDKEFWMNHNSYFFEKVIVLTADLTFETQEYLRKKHYFNLLYKPISIDDFYAKICDILKNRKTTKKKENSNPINSNINSNIDINKSENLIHQNQNENKYNLNENEFIGLDNFFIKLNKNAKLFEKIKNHFNNNIKVDLEKLKLYHNNNDYKNLNYLAHKLKSEISNFDFDKITDILRDIEQSAKEEKVINYEIFEELEYYINILIEKFIKFEIN